MFRSQSSVPASELRALDDADHTRADAILAGLEKVPTELVRRYEKLRAAEGQNADGCAICRDDLCAEENIVSLYAVLPFHPEACHPEASTVFAFPCAGALLRVEPVAHGLYLRRLPHTRTPTLAVQAGVWPLAVPLQGE